MSTQSLSQEQLQNNELRLEQNQNQNSQSSEQNQQSHNTSQSNLEINELDQKNIQIKQSQPPEKESDQHLNGKDQNYFSKENEFQSDGDNNQNIKNNQEEIQKLNDDQNQNKQRQQNKCQSLFRQILILLIFILIGLYYYFQEDPIICYVGQLPNEQLMEELLAIANKQTFNFSRGGLDSYLGEDIFAQESKFADFELEFQKNIYLAEQIQKQEQMKNNLNKQLVKDCNALVYVTNDYSIETQLNIQKIVQMNKSKKSHISVIHDLYYLDQKYQEFYKNQIEQSTHFKLINQSQIYWIEEINQQKISHFLVENNFSKVLKTIKELAFNRISEKNQINKEEIIFLQGDTNDNKQKFKYHDQSNLCYIETNLTEKKQTNVTCEIKNEDLSKVKFSLKKRENLKQYLVIQFQNSRIEIILYYPNNQIVQKQCQKDKCEIDLQQED